MTKLKIWLIVAASLVFAGLILFAGVMTVFGWDFAGVLLNSRLQTVESEVTKDFKNISILTDTDDITFMPSNDGRCYVESREYKNVTHVIEVRDDTLKISVLDSRKWYEMISFWGGSPKITVYLPFNEYEALIINESTGNVIIPAYFSFKSIDVKVSTGNVECYASATEFIKIKASTGDVFVKEASSGSMSLSTTTGKITVQNVTLGGGLEANVTTGRTQLSHVKCKSLDSSGNSGSIELDSVLADEKMTINRNTGDVKFELCDAGEICVETTTGSVKGSLLSDKVFFTKTTTGKIDVPESITGGKCKITTTTGNIIINVE